MAKPTESSTADQIKSEHAELREIVESIKQSLDAQVKMSSTLAEELAAFTVVLQNHFRGEEADQGFYDQIASQDIRFASQIKRLSKEHQAILAMAGPISDTVSQSDLSKTRSEFEELCTLLARHESDEHELMQKAYSEDIGSKD